MQRFGALVCGLWLLAGSTNAWSKSQSDYPAYEPPRFEDMPAAPAAPQVNEPETPPEQAPAASAPEPAETPAVQPPAPVKKGPDHYQVRIYQENGDCLWRIAEKVYGDRSKWKLIYLANRDIIRDPNKIYPRMKLKIPPADWQPDVP